MSTQTVKEPVSNDGQSIIDMSKPYVVKVTLAGISDILFHRWSCEAVEEKANAIKGSRAKKTDDVESFVYRCEDGTIGIPGTYLRQAIVGAAKYLQSSFSQKIGSRFI
jgi:hypothetical protein